MIFQCVNMHLNKISISLSILEYPMDFCFENLNSNSPIKEKRQIGPKTVSFGAFIVLVDPKGIEPSTSRMRTERSPS